MTYRALMFVFGLLLAVVWTLCPPGCLSAGAEEGLVTLVFPLMSPHVTSQFGKRTHPILQTMNSQHTGVDLAAPEYAHVRAVAAGVVVWADLHAGYGKLVTIDHGSGFVSLYGHLDEIRVNPGERVPAGKVIGRLGSTGMSTGPHLHFEWRKNGVPVDPLAVFPALAAEASG